MTADPTSRPTPFLFPNLAMGIGYLLSSPAGDAPFAR